jgi:hypothetical protein
MPAIRISNGTLFDPWNPEIKGQKDTPTWDWLGHHLANECRYAGGSKWYYSVAQHSVLASRYVANPHPGYDGSWYKKTRLAALLHDATEAVLLDVPGPYKHAKGSSVFSRYKKLEGSLAGWMYEQFGLGEEYLNAPPIKAIDKELLDAERFVLFPGLYEYSGTIRVEPWDREYARDAFNQCLRDLTK